MYFYGQAQANICTQRVRAIVSDTGALIFVAVFKCIIYSAFILFHQTFQGRLLLQLQYFPSCGSASGQ